MVYSSNLFVILLPVFVVVFYALRLPALQRSYLFLASIAFVAVSGLLHCAVLLATVLGSACYFALPVRYRQQPAVYGGFIALLILNLAYYKYSAILLWMGLSGGLRVDSYLLIPLGISFYTFQSIGAIYDERDNPHPPSPFRFSLFIFFFPQLVSGPICTVRQLAGQFDTAKKFSTRNVMIGSQLFVLGYFKKVMIADPIAAVIDPIWSNSAGYGWGAMMMCIIGFYIQVYCDFSGYTDMGRGVARILGYRLPINFRAPYLASSPIEFWQRWHITLSMWVRNYLYANLALMVLRRIRERRVQRGALAVVIVFTMVILGLWHGSEWRFVVFGVIQGLFIVSWHLMVTPGRNISGIRRLGLAFGTQLVLLISFTFFRAPQPEQAAQILTDIIQFAEGRELWGAWLGLSIASIATFAIQAIDYHATKRSFARILLRARVSPLLFAVSIATLTLMFSLKGITLEGLWIGPNEKFFGGGGEQFIYFAF